MSDPRAPANVFDPERFMTYVRQLGHGGALGIAYQSHGEDWVELSMPYAPHLVGMPESGIIASGPIISLMDNATSMAVWTRRGRFAPQVTLDLRVDYMRAAVPHTTLIGRGECYKLTRSIAFVRGIAYEDDPADPVAHVAGTFMMLGDQA